MNQLVSPDEMRIQAIFELACNIHFYLPNDEVWQLLDEKLAEGPLKGWRIGSAAMLGDDGFKAAKRGLFCVRQEPL